MYKIDIDTKRKSQRQDTEAQNLYDCDNSSLLTKVTAAKCLNKVIFLIFNPLTIVREMRINIKRICKRYNEKFHAHGKP